MRYVFGVSWLALQESIVYMHAAVFLAAAGYTLLHDGHVRVDIFYRPASARRQAFVDLCGAILFLLPMSVSIFVISFPYVAKSWRVLETSQEGSGIPAVFLLKTIILVYTVLVALQGIALALRSIMTLSGIAPPPRPVEDGPANSEPTAPVNKDQAGDKSLEGV
ncbi:MAG: TRAP transporter small permease subunit, partial [Alphaproteobacteria bacterium]|nr:TRAP transporter small permease subunit [Alphaproteobacteria bacterium]